MNYLVKDETLELKYEFGKGAWTYHIQLPNTKHLIGKWGSLKVAGTIDDYVIESINLFTIAGQDKLISVNEKIRKFINKTGGDTVTVSLYLISPKLQLTEKEILETFKEANVIEVFNIYPIAKRNEIINEITSLKSSEKQLKVILKHINLLSNSFEQY